jgi:hypothetical protein
MTPREQMNDEQVSALLAAVAAETGTDPMVRMAEPEAIHDPEPPIRFGPTARHAIGHTRDIDGEFVVLHLWDHDYDLRMHIPADLAQRITADLWEHPRRVERIDAATRKETT